MPKLLDLPKADRKEKTRAIARLVYAAMEPADDAVCLAESTVNSRFYQGMCECGMVEDQECYGDAFSTERQQLVDEFEVFFREGQAYATMYDDCVAPVDRAAPHFAVPSHSLLRMWCVAHFWKVLSKDDGPFADLQVVVGNGMDEGNDTNGEGEEEGSSEEEEEEDDDDEDTDSDESDSDSGEEGEGDYDDDDDDDELGKTEKALEKKLEERKKEKKQRVE